MAHEQLKSAVNMAMSNVNATCKEFVKTEVYASRSMAALQKDLGNGKDAASALAGTQVAQAKQSAIDAFSARSASILQTDTLSASRRQIHAAPNQCRRHPKWGLAILVCLG